MGLHQGLESFPNQESLNLTGCRNLTDEGLVEILKISGSKIRRLNLSQTRITGTGFHHAGVKSLAYLETLKRSGCSKLTDGGLAEMVRKPKSELGDLNLKQAKSLPCLETLNLSYCYKLTGEGLGEILTISGSKDQKPRPRGR